MPLEIMNVGFGNLVNVTRVIAVTRAGSAPVRRMVGRAERSGRLVDATNGRRTRAVIVTDSNHIILSHLNPQTIGERLSGTSGELVRRSSAPSALAGEEGSEDNGDG